MTYDWSTKGSVEELDGNAFFVIDSAEDLEAKWPQIATDDSAFLKLRIAFSDQ